MSLKTELDAILNHAAIAPLNDRAFLRITGSDATRWLNGMVTNSVQALAPGEGCYNFLLNAQGRILADLTVYREIDPAEPASFLLETGNSQLETVRTHLDHFIIMDDVELVPSASNEQTVLLLGTEAPELLHAYYASSKGPDLSTLPALRLAFHPELVQQVTTKPQGSSVAFEITSSHPDALMNFARKHGATEVSPEALEALRLIEGRPLYGRDITEKYLPQETNQLNALHFNKGCYLGQEIVERIRSRGQVHRLLTSLTLTGEFPTELPSPIEADGKPVGEITSAAVVPLPEGDQILALGYVRREALDTHAALTYSGGTAAPRNASKERPITTNQ